MKYSEIIYDIYGWDSYEDRRNAENKLSGIDRKVWLIMKDLEGRSGFDHWWGDIDDDLKDGIFDSIKEILAKD